MSTSTNLSFRCILSAFFSLFLLASVSASPNSYTINDSCSAEIVVEYDSLGRNAILTVSHSGSPNSTLIWSDSSNADEITVTESAEYCVIVITETQCIITTCVNIDLGNSPNCQSYIVQEPLSDGTFRLIAETNDTQPNTSYQWTSGERTNSIIVNETGEYCLVVTSSNGCPSQACIYIEVPDQNNPCDPIANSSLTDTDGDGLTDCEETTGQDNPNTSAVPNGLSDENNPNDPYLHSDSCTITVFAFPDTINGGAYVGVDPSGIGPFIYSWSDGSSSNGIDIDASGEYCVTVTDANGCIAIGCKQVQVSTANHTIAFSVPKNLELFSDMDCQVDTSLITTGYIDSIYTSCGSGYDATYNDIISFNCSGSYSIIREWTIADDCGNTKSQIQIISVIDSIAPSFVIPNDVILYVDANSCSANTSTDVTGNVTNLIDNCSSNLNTFYEDNISTIADDSPCGYRKEIERIWTVLDDCGNQSQGSQIITLIDSSQNVATDSCYIDAVMYELRRINNLVALAVDPAGVAPYSYVWSNGIEGEVIDVQHEGEVCVTITDANGCIGQACYYVEFPTTIPDTCSVWIEQIPQADGSVKVWAHAQGDGDKIYTWSDSATGTSGEPYIYASESGEYCVTVIDGQQCQSTACIDVVIDTTQPDSCYSTIIKAAQSDNRYKLSVEPDGVAPFTIVWHDSLYQDGDYLYIDQSGYYCATVYDANQCESTACIQVDIDPVPVDSCSLEITSTLFASDFVAEVKAEPFGIAPFTYIWSDGSNGNAVEIRENKEVCVTVTDASGCVSTKCLFVEVPQRSCSLQIIRGANSTDSEIVLEAITEGTGDVSYLWNDSSTSNLLIVTESGEYCLTILTANGCTKTECIYIEIDSSSCQTDININPNSSDYEVILDAAPAGVGPFTFKWSNGSTSSTIMVNETGTYCVVVVDAQGCVSEYCKEVFVAIPECESRILVKSETDDKVTIEVEPVGMAPFTYYWSTGEGTKKIRVTVSKEYCVEVIDALGCISYDCKYIEVVDYSQCSVEIDVIAETDSTHKVIANPSGTAPFTYQWSHGDTSRYFYPQLDGKFCVTVTDAEGCVSETCLTTEGITPSVEMEAFPNPAHGDFFVEIDSELEFQGRVEIRDMKGNLLFTVPIDIEKGIQGMNFSSDEYPSGIFFVNIIRGSHVESIKVIKAGN